MNQLRDRAVPVIESGWATPFFYEDSRHVFFVTTEEKQKSFGERVDYGVMIHPNSMRAVEVPPLVVQVDSRKQKEIWPNFWGDGRPISPDPGVIDAAPMRQFVTEDAYIRQGIGTTGVLTFGDQQIGPLGSIRGVRMTK